MAALTREVTSANFNPRAPCGARLSTRSSPRSTSGFQPTRPLRGATASCTRRPAPPPGISTHAPLAGRDAMAQKVNAINENFNPRAPCGARPKEEAICLSLSRNFNPRAPCGARPRRRRLRSRTCFISTHAPLAGRDGDHGAAGEPGEAISTHAPLAGRDVSSIPSRTLSRNFNPRAPCGARPRGMGHNPVHRLFQPTRPLRGATAAFPQLSLLTAYFNPRAPCGARPQLFHSFPSSQRISTHAPLAGRDSKSVQITMHIFAITDKFQMLLHRMPPVRAFCSFLMQENHADFGCEPPR